MTFNLDQECESILGELPTTLPNHSENHNRSESEITQFMQRGAALLFELQKEFPGLAGKKMGGMNRLYLFDPSTFIKTLERDVVTHWLQHPESLRLTARQVASLASSWYGRPVSEHRIKRQFRCPDLIGRLQKLCYDHDNATNISNCRSLPEIQKRLRFRACQSSDTWKFRGEIAFHADGSVTIGNCLAQQDKTSAGKRRVRGCGSAISVDALRNVLQAYS